MVIRVLLIVDEAADTVVETRTKNKIIADAKAIECNFY